MSIVSSTTTLIIWWNFANILITILISSAFKFAANLCKFQLSFLFNKRGRFNIDTAKNNGHLFERQFDDRISRKSLVGNSPKCKFNFVAFVRMRTILARMIWIICGYFSSWTTKHIQICAPVQTGIYDKPGAFTDYSFSPVALADIPKMFCQAQSEKRISATFKLTSQTAFHLKGNSHRNRIALEKCLEWRIPCILWLWSAQHKWKLYVKTSWIF